MKTKYTAILMALFIGVQSTFACEFCGAKNAAHGRALEVMIVAARLLSTFADVYGTNSIEGYYFNTDENSQHQDLSDEDDQDDSNDTEIVNETTNTSSEASSSSVNNNNINEAVDTAQADQQPLYLVGENHFNAVDQQFNRAITVLAQGDQLLYAMEGVDYEENAEGIPSQTDGLPIYGTEDPFAQTVTNFITMRAMLNWPNQALYHENTRNQILNDFIDIVNQVIEPQNEAFMGALYRNHDLQNDPLFQFILKYKDILLKKDAKARDTMLRKALTPFILGNKTWFFKNIKPFLNQAIPLLIQHMNTLPRSLRIPQGNMNVLTQLNTLDVEYALQVTARWRNLFIIENLKKIHAHAEYLGLPMVAIFGGEHINQIQTALGNSLPVTSNLKELPINAAIKEAKQKRIDEGEFEVF